MVAVADTASAPAFSAEQTSFLPAKKSGSESRQHQQKRTQTHTFSVSLSLSLLFSKGYQDYQNLDLIERYLKSTASTLARQ
jgi:hypothetical protein